MLHAQVAVEGEKQLIVATEVSSNASDQGRLVPLVDEVEVGRLSLEARGRFLGQERTIPWARW